MRNVGITSAGWARTYSLLLLVGDVSIIVFALLGALRFSSIDLDSPLSGGLHVTSLAVPYWAVCLALVVTWSFLLEGSGSRKPDCFAEGTEEFTRVFNSTVVLLIAVAMDSFLARAEPSRLFLGVTLISGLVLLLFFRAAARRIVWMMRSQEKMKTTVFLVGTAQSNAAVVRHASNPLVDAYRVVGELALSKKELQEQSFVEKVVDNLKDDEGESDLVILTAPQLVTPHRRDELSARLELLTKGTALWANPEEVVTTRMRFRLDPSAPIIRLRDVQLSALASSYKRVVDLVLSSLALIALSPAFVVIAVAIKIDSPGTVFFRQIRVGQFGRDFSILKFRTMVQDAENIRTPLESLTPDAGNKVLFKMKSDPRVTPVGRILRGLSLDELPQLVNVFLGKMSLVGPRPPLPSEVATYEGGTHRRLAAKPGITGLWQISGRSDLDWDESVKLDLQYVENWSPIVDILILLKTLPAVLDGKGAY